MKSTSSSLISLASLLLLSACASSTPAPESAPADSAEPSSAAASGSSAPNNLELAKAVAATGAASLDGAKSAEAEIVLTLRIRVDGKVSAIQINGADATVLEGAEAVTSADFTLDLSTEQAQAIAAGEITLAAASKDGKTDNPDGVARFVSFLTKVETDAGVPAE